MKFFLTAVCLCAAAAAHAQIPYKVIVPVADAADGTWVYMTDIDRRADVDSAQVADHKAVFQGDVDEPYMVTVSAGNKHYGTLVLEQGTSTINQLSGFGVGTMLNDQLKAVVDELTATKQQLADAGTDKDSVIAKYVDIELAAIDENSDNPIAYFMFLDVCQYIPAEMRRELVRKYPDLSVYERVKEIIAE